MDSASLVSSVKLINTICVVESVRARERLCGVRGNYRVPQRGFPGQSVALALNITAKKLVFVVSRYNHAACAYVVVRVCRFLHPGEFPVLKEASCCNTRHEAERFVLRRK